jgi:uncharacterized protein (TIGR03083 family)
MTPSNREPVVDHLGEVWTSLSLACGHLDDQQWALSTDCPGWSVKDQLSHLIGVERMLLGEPSPPASVPTAEHVRNPVGQLNEAWVAARRPVPGDEVLAEFVETTDRRLESLRAMSTEKFDVIGPSPIGQVPYREFMETRVIDSWAHEQDVRRALGRPGGRNGPGEATSLERCFGAMPFVVGKRVAPPDGTTVRFDVGGELGAQEVVGMDGGRASIVTSTSSESPTVALAMDQDTFWRLGFGRVGSDEALASGSVTLDGDVELGHRVLDAMGFMI